MKIKLVLMKPDKHNAVVYPTKKQIIGRTVHYKKHVYFLHESRFRITRRRRWWGYRQHYMTYYYAWGVSTALPEYEISEVAEIGPDQSVKALAPLDPDAHRKLVEDGDGISGEELGVLFDPFLYGVLKLNGATKVEKLMFYLMVGCIALSGYTAWSLYQLQQSLTQAGVLG